MNRMVHAREQIYQVGIPLNTTYSCRNQNDVLEYKLRVRKTREGNCDQNEF